MLPFEFKEMRRYGFSLLFMKLLLLKYFQTQTFKKTDGLIFLTQYAKKSVLRMTGKLETKIVVIPHGIDGRFFSPPRPQRKMEDFSTSSPCLILYVSHIEQYKHQWNVAEAMAKLKARGFNVRLELVGPRGNAINRLLKTLNRIDPKGDFIIYRGAVPYEKLHEFYAKADINIFASSCENMPNILLEGMASGLPIACSNKGPMKEVLGDAGEYFDPEVPDDIADALIKMIESPKLRQTLSENSFKRVQQYSWEKCSNETFRFLRNVTLGHRQE
jgi:glycosyltransferase involved in cell wall biosynthesis